MQSNNSTPLRYGKKGFIQTHENGKSYLCLQHGQRLQLATQLEDLNQAIEALDLDLRKEEIFPIEICNHPQLKVLRIKNCLSKKYN